VALRRLLRRRRRLLRRWRRLLGLLDLLGLAAVLPLRCLGRLLGRRSLAAVLPLRRLRRRRFCHLSRRRGRSGGGSSGLPCQGRKRGASAHAALVPRLWELRDCWGVLGQAWLQCESDTGATLIGRRSATAWAARRCRPASLFATVAGPTLQGTPNTGAILIGRRSPTAGAARRCRAGSLFARVARPTLQGTPNTGAILAGRGAPPRRCHRSSPLAGRGLPPRWPGLHSARRSARSAWRQRARLPSTNRGGARRATHAA